MTLDQIIEGVLFYKAAPQKKQGLQKLLGVDDEAFTSALAVLDARLTSGATRLVHSDTTLELVTAPELDPLIETLRKEDLKRDIGRAGAETLAIIMYRGPLERAEIDRIRGVNSSYILRNLLMRGLIEKTGNQNKTYYGSTTELLAHLGISSQHELPDYDTVMQKLSQFESTQEYVG